MRRSFYSASLLALAACATQHADDGDTPLGPSFARAPEPIPLGVTIADLGTRVRSDGNGEYIDGVDGVSAYIDGTGNLHFNTGGAGRNLVLDYSVQVSGPPISPVPPTRVQILTGLNGLLQPEPPLPELAVGSGACYPVTVAYQTATTKTWGPFYHANLDNTATSPTTYISITRASTTTWELSSSSACPGTPDLAGVHYTPNTTLKPKDQVTLHGTFSMPLSMVLRKL